MSMKRRDVIALVGAAAAWPLAAQGQQALVPVVGYLSNRRASESADVDGAFVAGLEQAGYVAGRNVSIEYRMADDRLDRLPELAADLVRRKVDVIAATGGIASARAAKTATTTIPIVFTNGTDPINFGLVGDLKRPGGNITGVSMFVAAPGPQRLALLRELVPNAAWIAVLADPTNLDAETNARELRAAAASTGLKIEIIELRSEPEFEPAIASAVKRGAGALFVSNEVLFTSRRERVVSLAARHGLPASYAYAEFAASGGLMSYGPSRKAGYRLSGTYAARILKGEKPGDLPVQQPSRFELVLNLKTAKALGLAVPPALLKRADEVIE